MSSWSVLNSAGRKIGSVTAQSYGTAFVAAQDRYGDAMSAVVLGGWESKSPEPFEPPNWESRQLGFTALD